MKDEFARALARRALEVAIGDRNPMFHGKCALCSHPCRGRYCHACSWAYGNEEHDRRSQHAPGGFSAATGGQEGF